VGAVDKDGRNLLSIAASEGKLEAVKYLISNDANLSIRDARNNDALADARREGHTDVVTYLESLISDAVIHEHCSDFADGIFRKGVQ
jgi:glutaminase